jgi:hypothetical protein
VQVKGGAEDRRFLRCIAARLLGMWGQNDSNQWVGVVADRVGLVGQALIGGPVEPDQVGQVGTVAGGWARTVRKVSRCRWARRRASRELVAARRD